MERAANRRNRDFYSGKRVFVTGHTGYKGAWLTAILRELGAEMTGYALGAQEGSMFEAMNGSRLVHSVEGDVRDFEHLQETMLSARPEIVIHLAAQAIVKDCFDNPCLRNECDGNSPSA